MKSKPIYLGQSEVKSRQTKASGGYVTIENETYYKIKNFDKMPPFFMSIVSDSDHWMFISSNGALTAGRKNPDHALFPYYTDDKIQDSVDTTGSKTIIFIEEESKKILWEPFSKNSATHYAVERNCYKNVYGNKLIFEEINPDLNLSFRYAWLSSERFGFTKKSYIKNNGRKSVRINILDGIQNILTYGINQRFQNEYSTLADAYKRNELDRSTNLGIYSLSSIPVDKAEPSEALKATTVWSDGLEPACILISSNQLESFYRGEAVTEEIDIRAARGAYLINSGFDLKSDEEKVWYCVAEIERDASDIVALRSLLRNKKTLIGNLEDDIALGATRLQKIVASSDGLQMSQNKLSSSRHFSNVLFNVMRGGVFEDNYNIDTTDLAKYLHEADNKLYNQYQSFINGLPNNLSYMDLLDSVLSQKNADLEKLCYEYLPLTFSRRHGDPSRPWNRFSIDIKNEKGEKVLNYQGNWRDIFQNWEALALSFPVYIESMIAKFVNASTIDGYNPYRVTRDGFDWEILDPADPWSYIGYWGDHQIIYLLKLLELSGKFHPGKLQEFLVREIFTYADVPYRIKSYKEILKDPQNTIDFDPVLDSVINNRVKEIGSQGKVVRSNNGGIYHVNLTEKLLVPILTKLSNFIPEAGIWMNTQRPEWNDANNALVGFGVSMVTLYYLRRHLVFCKNLFSSVTQSSVPISNEVADLLASITKILDNNRAILRTEISDKVRKDLMDKLGEAGSSYRSHIYSESFSDIKSEVAVSDISSFFKIALDFIDHSVRANKRKDHLYHAYNLINIKNDKEVSIRYLYEMLEGQVGILSSECLSATEAISVLRSLKKSALFREDQFTYILYPNRDLNRFVDKNNIPSKAFQQSSLLQKLIETGNQEIVDQDIEGGIHFNGQIRNAAELKAALENLSLPDLKPLLEKETNLVLEIYEDLFDHQSFTGRSGTFFKYEGLGCIYWHMVSKLLLAVQETYYRAVENNEEKSLISQLREYYYDIGKGIGVNKTPDQFGAFPTDAYSHTPAHTGAQQPGMTGQVKEDILSRFGELGVLIKEGTINFHTGLLKKEEFLSTAGSFTYFTINGVAETIELDKGCLAFTLAQVPFIYHLDKNPNVTITRKSGETETILENGLNKTICSSIFERRGTIQRVDVYFDPDV